MAVPTWVSIVGIVIGLGLIGYALYSKKKDKKNTK